jgi:hypothetical protein
VAKQQQNKPKPAAANGHAEGRRPVMFPQVVRVLTEGERRQIGNNHEHGMRNVGDLVIPEGGIRVYGDGSIEVDYADGSREWIRGNVSIFQRGEKPITHQPLTNAEVRRRLQAEQEDRIAAERAERERLEREANRPVAPVGVDAAGPDAADEVDAPPIDDIDVDDQAGDVPAGVEPE